jgi:DNA-binding CsgD family transcriptional regulator
MKSAVRMFEKMNSLPASAAILDSSGRIVAVNDYWKEFGRRNGLRVPHSAIGSNYLQYCQSDEPTSRRFVRKLRALLAGNLELLTFVYPCHSPTQKRWFSLIGFPLSPDQPAGVALLHVNLTGMLPAQIGAQQSRAQGQPKVCVRQANDLDAISSAVECSVSETLSSQLSTMLTPRQVSKRENNSVQLDTDKIILVRTQLSNRQIQVLRLLGEGKTNKEMAKALVLSPNTVRLHVSAILKRLNLRSRTHAALLSSRLNKQEWTELGGGDLTSWKRCAARPEACND